MTFVDLVVVIFKRCQIKDRFIQHHPAQGLLVAWPRQEEDLRRAAMEVEEKKREEQRMSLSIELSITGLKGVQRNAFKNCGPLMTTG